MLDESLDSTQPDTPSPAPRRRRARAAAPAPTQEAAPAEGATPAATPDADVTTPDADQKPAPARRTRRPRTAKAPVDAPTDGGGDAPSAVADPAGRDAQTDAPLTPAAPASDASAAVTDAGDVPGDVTVTERRPARRTRRPARPAVTPAADTPVADAPVSGAASADDTTVPSGDADAPATTVATRAPRKSAVARRTSTATGVERRRRATSTVATVPAEPAEGISPAAEAAAELVAEAAAPAATSGPSWVLVTSDEETSIQGESAEQAAPARSAEDEVVEVVEVVAEPFRPAAGPADFVLVTDDSSPLTAIVDAPDAAQIAPVVGPSDRTGADGVIEADVIETDVIETDVIETDVIETDIAPVAHDFVLVTDDADDADDDDEDPIAARMRALAGEVSESRQRRPRGRADETLDDLAAAIAGGAGVVELIDDEDDADDDADDEVADDTAGDADDATPRRRRRRRGGRRRRREPADTGDEADEDAAAEHTDEPEPAEDAETPASDADEDTVEQDGTDGARRRRRRRRRRREEVASADDDPTEVVVRVREPRARRAPSGDQVTGIEGSTRLEAKRLRRREGRAAGRRRAPILSESEFLARRESVDRRMLVRQTDEYNQIAVLEDGVLVEHYVDRASATSLIGNVYLGRVQNVLPSMEAVFVDIGRGRNAILYAGEVDWDSLGTSDRRVEAVFKSGQTVLVQVTKDPVGAKGARLTSHVSIPGRYVVYAPGGHLSGISRKLPEHERSRLKSILSGVVAETASVIIRTAAEGASEEELVRDVNRLRAQWEVIEKKVKQGPAPKLLYAEPDLTVRIVRDLFTEDFASLVVNGNGSSDDAYETVKAYVDHVAPHLAERLSMWEGPEDIFAANRIDEQIAKALERKVHLPSGGSLIIDRTEAMTVIDVNTGKFTGSGGNLEATVTSNNLEAAEEIVRQLRLRDIGGIIVIDFIDMVLPSNRELLLRRLVECLGRDRTRHQVSEVTSLGLVQMTRKKLGTGLAESFTEVCEHCGGRGYIRHSEPVATQAPSDGGERSQRSRGRH